MGDTRDEPTRSAGGLANEPEEGFMRVTPDPTDKTALQFSGSPSELADMIDELERQKLVERYPDPEHGVIKRVRLASRGRAWASEPRCSRS